jgi:hypothetical protein
MPKAEIAVRFLPMKKETILAMGHPVAGDFKIIDDRKVIKLKARLQLEFAKKSRSAKLEMDRSTSLFSFDEKGEYTLEIQKKLHTQMKQINKIVQSGKASTKEFKKEIAAYRIMNLENKLTLLNLRIPHLGLEKGEMAGFEIEATNKINGEVFGGITLLVIGKD